MRGEKSLVVNTLVPVCLLGTFAPGAPAAFFRINPDGTGFQTPYTFSWSTFWTIDGPYSPVEELMEGWARRLDEDR